MQVWAPSLKPQGHISKVNKQINCDFLVKRKIITITVDIVQL